MAKGSRTLKEKIKEARETATTFGKGILPSAVDMAVEEKAMEERVIATATATATATKKAADLHINELKRKKTVPMEALEEYASASRQESGEVLRFSGGGPDELLMARERRERLMQTIDGLNDESRELIMLRFFEQMSAKEIADVMGSTQGAIRTRLHRLLASLREQQAAGRDDW